tara:strand:- start:449 stop:667 length:219 start_codon:yes stop_codon:yes gene_type:complete
VKVQLYFSFSRLTKKKKSNFEKFSFHFSSFLFQHTTNTNTRKSLINADVLSHVREFTVHREEEEEDNRGGGV